MLLLFWNGAQTSPPSLSIVTGNPIGLLLALTYTAAASGAVRITPSFGTIRIRTGSVAIVPTTGGL